MSQVNLSESALERINQIRQKDENHEKFLRITVESGGCSGFQYVFGLDKKQIDGDIKILEKNSEILAITDEASLPFLEGATIDFIKELGASYFKVTNPNAKANCGCGSSFSV